MLRAGAGIAALVLGASLLAGCSETQGDVGNRNIRPNSVLTDGNGNKVIDKRFANDPLNEQNRVYGRQLNTNNLIGRHQNYRLEMGQEIADEISRAEGLGEVTVILTDRNAYVAAPEGGSGTGRREAGRTRSPQSDRQAAGDDKGIAYPHQYEGPDTGRDTDPLRNGMGMRSSRTDSRQGLPPAGGTGDAAAGGTLEERIAGHVKRLAPRIEQVFVSRQADFVSRMNSYAETARGGEPIQGYIAEFNAMVERIFPAESGIRISRTGPRIHD